MRWLCVLAITVLCGPASADDYRVTKVVDGDTIRVDGLDGSLRLLGIDTEETFKSRADREAAAAGLADYMAAKRGDSARPVKMATPMGEQAKRFAQAFFAGVERVRIERDDPQEIRDHYNRYLAYVLVERNGVWVNYNVEAVRAGMSPYFTKYGTSRRYHAQFVAAEAEAKRAKRGIWAPDAPGYPDYPERAAWWNARAAFVDAFRKLAAAHDNYIDITHEDAIDRLSGAIGKQVVVLGIVEDVRESDKGPSKILLGRRPGDAFPLVVFDRNVLVTSRVGQWKGEFATVTGVPSRYRGHLEIVIDKADQLQLSPLR